MEQYRRKPQVVSAFRLTQEIIDAAWDRSGKLPVSSMVVCYEDGIHYHKGYISTIKGKYQEGYIGDWIVRMEDGDYIFYSHHEFIRLYEPVDPVARDQANESVKRSESL